MMQPEVPQGYEAPATIAKNRGDAVLLGLLAGSISWLYTYDRDKAKMWVGLGLEVSLYIVAVIFVTSAIIATGAIDTAGGQLSLGETADAVRESNWEKYALFGVLVSFLVIRLWILFDRLTRPLRWYAEFPRRPLSQTAAVLLAVFTGPFTWLYTYDKDKGKFWPGFAILSSGNILNLVSDPYSQEVGTGTFALAMLIGLAGLGFYIWGIVNAAVRNSDWYRNYPYRN